MADEAPGFVVPKWAAAVLLGVLFSMIIAGYSQGSALALQSDRTVQQLEFITKQLVKLEEQVERLRAGTADRWTLTQHHAYAAAVAADLRDMRQRMASHEALPWHREAGAEHAETKRRVARLEEEMGEVRRELREAAAAKKKE